MKSKKTKSKSVTCPIGKLQIEKAIEALQTVVANDKTKMSNDLISGQPRIQLQVTFHKIPVVKNKRIFLNLPNALYTEKSDICLITKDVDKKDTEKTVEHYEMLLAKNNINEIKEILPLTRLKLDYKPYEAKRKLCNLYDLILCEETILHRMPSLTGKYFLQKRKDPWGIQLGNKKDIRKVFDKTFHKTRWFISGNGSSSLIFIANSSDPKKNINENLTAAIEGVAAFCPRGWENVKSLMIKTEMSTSIPLYINDECPEEIDNFDEQEVNTILRGRKYKSAPKQMLQKGGVHIVKKRKRPTDGKEYFLNTKSKKVEVWD